MGNTDWAIIVGIQSYPGMPPLKGPDNDARDFYEWVVDDNGGAVPKNQATLIITPSNKIPFKNVEQAKPTYTQLEHTAHKLIDLTANKPLKDNHKYLGRRLYLYYAGHGFAPREEQTALIMANATKLQIGAGFHWLGQRTAEWFYRAGYFDEIVLLMDCCRTVYSVPALSWPWTDETANDFQQRVKRFYAFATGWSLEARGEPDAAGKVHGIFTKALLDGLRGKGNVPNSNLVTTDSLSVYIRSQIPGLQPSDFRADSFELGRVGEKANEFLVRVHIPLKTEGKKVEVITFFNGVQTIVDSTDAVPPVWCLKLENGFYQAQVPAMGLKKLFSVTGSEVPDVEFN